MPLRRLGRGHERPQAQEHRFAATHFELRIEASNVRPDGFDGYPQMLSGGLRRPALNKQVKDPRLRACQPERVANSKEACFELVAAAGDQPVKGTLLRRGDPAGGDDEMGASPVDRHANAFEFVVCLAQQGAQRLLRSPDVKLFSHLGQWLLRRQPLACERVGPVNVKILVDEKQRASDRFKPLERELSRIGGSKADSL